MVNISLRKVFLESSRQLFEDIYFVIKDNDTKALIKEIVDPKLEKKTIGTVFPYCYSFI